MDWKKLDMTCFSVGTKLVGLNASTVDFSIDFPYALINQPDQSLSQKQFNPLSVYKFYSLTILQI